MQASPDDIEDIIELTKKLNSNIDKILKKYDYNIAMSVLINSCVHYIIDHCNDIDQAIYLGEVLGKVYQKNLNTFK